MTPRSVKRSPAEQFSQRNIDEFRANHGRVGGNFAGAPLLLLHAVGARSGQWQANPDAAVEVGDETIAVRATELTDAEGDEKYSIQSERFPGFAGYQQQTSRTIPVIALIRRDAPASVGAA